MGLIDPVWLAPDERGIRIAWLSDPGKSTLRGRRLRATVRQYGKNLKALGELANVGVDCAPPARST